MTVIHNGRAFKFRPCDTVNISQEELQKLADTIGYMQYEPNMSWLVIRSIGYGWLVDE